MRIIFREKKQEESVKDQGLSVPYGAGKRVAYRLRWYLILLLITSPLLALAYYLSKDFLVTEASGIVTVEPVEIRAPQAALVTYLPQTPGSRVTTDAVLLVLHDQQLVDDLLILRQQMDALALNLESEQQLLLENYQLAVREARQAVDEQNKLFKQYQQYAAQGAVPLADRVAITRGQSDAALRLYQSEINLQAAKNSIQIDNATGPIASARRDINRELIRTQTRLDALSVTSPFDATIIDINVKAGERVEENQLLALLSDKQQPLVVAYLHPRHIDRTQAGTPVTVRFPNGDRHQATVARDVELATKLPPQLTTPFEGSPAMLRVRLEFTTPVDRTSWVEGMPVTVRF